jgi:hypothetical protein
MTLWCSKDKFNIRLAQIQAALVQRDLDIWGTLEPETTTEITSFYLRHYLSSKGVVIFVKDELYLLRRDVSVYYLIITCTFSYSTFWLDVLGKLEERLGMFVRTLSDKVWIGIEADSLPLNINIYLSRVSLPEFANRLDVSDMVVDVRLSKSPLRVEYLRNTVAAMEVGKTADVKAFLVKASNKTPVSGALSSGERASHRNDRLTDQFQVHADALQIEPNLSSRHYNMSLMAPSIKIAAASIDTLAAVTKGKAVTFFDCLYREPIPGEYLVYSHLKKIFYFVWQMIIPSFLGPLEVKMESDCYFEISTTFHSYLLVGDFGFYKALVEQLGSFQRCINHPRTISVCG